MSTEEVAEYLNITPGRVRHLAQRGDLLGEKVGRDWVFRRDDVIDYAARRRGPGRPGRSK